jgi:hypothetical protein
VRQQWEVPANLHNAVSQQAILLKPGLANLAGKFFMEYLKSPATINIIQK